MVIIRSFALSCVMHTFCKVLAIACCTHVNVVGMNRDGHETLKHENEIETSKQA